MHYDNDREEAERLRVEASSLERRAERHEADGRSHYAEHLRKRADYNRREARNSS